MDLRDKCTQSLSPNSSTLLLVSRLHTIVWFVHGYMSCVHGYMFLCTWLYVLCAWLYVSGYMFLVICPVCMVICYKSCVHGYMFLGTGLGFGVRVGERFVLFPGLRWAWPSHN
jgi:hypothetical protein